MTLRSGEFVGGLLLGALVGAAVGLLFAPESGEELRGQIKEKAGDCKDRAARTGSEWLEKGRQVVLRKKEDLASKLGCCEEEEA